jgi:hypothetical protein
VYLKGRILMAVFVLCATKSFNLFLMMSCGTCVERHAQMRKQFTRLAVRTVRSAYSFDVMLTI